MEVRASLPFCRRALPLTFTSCSGIWRSSSAVAAVNRCAVRNGGAKAANQHVAGLRTGCADTVKKSRRSRLVQIEIATHAATSRRPGENPAYQSLAR